jgi:hypothetical protein
MAKKTVTIKGLDSKLWIKLKIQCLEEGKSVGAKLNEMIKEATK